MDRREWLALLGTLGAGFAANEACGDDHKGPQDGSSPVSGPHAHFCGIHIAKKDPKYQIVTQHYCTAHTGGDHKAEQIFQCLLFDSRAKNAKLLGVEYIISDERYRMLPAEEKKFWHPHSYEVLGGGLIAPGMDDEAERSFMKGVLTTWGKAWHTWPDPRTDVPIGEPLLIWSLTGDGQVNEQIVATRDREFGVSTGAIGARRRKEIGYEAPRVAPPASVDQVGRMWTDSGEDKPTPLK
jgi:hypothetical protein